MITPITVTVALAAIAISGVYYFKYKKTNSKLQEQKILNSKLYEYIGDLEETIHDNIHNSENKPAVPKKRKYNKKSHN